MKEKNYEAETEEMKVVEEKVAIDSEELASAIQDCEVDLAQEEEDGLNIGCVINKVV